MAEQIWLKEELGRYAPLPELDQMAGIIMQLDPSADGFVSACAMYIVPWAASVAAETSMAYPCAILAEGVVGGAVIFREPAEGA
jgi:hypothetical protein